MENQQSSDQEAAENLDQPVPLSGSDDQLPSSEWVSHPRQERKVDPQAALPDQDSQPVQASQSPTESPKLDPRIQMFSQDGGVSSDQFRPNDGSIVIEGDVRPAGRFISLIKKYRSAIAIAAGALVLVGGTYFSLGFYERYLRSFPVEKILPARANIVARITINPDGQQFQLLEKNLEKFPGYGLLKKQLDPVGEGKTVSQLIQDKFREEGLDFETDIKPAISDQAYVVIPDAGPLGKNIKNGALMTWNDSQAEYLALGDQASDGSGTAVLGDSQSKTEPIPLDFIIAAPIIDKQKAKEALDKMKKNGRYKLTAKKSDGYDYYELKAEDDGSDDAAKYVNYSTTYHALLGSNWVAASREDFLKQMIAEAKKQQLLSFSHPSPDTLESDADFQRVDQELGGKAEENLLRLYYNLNFNEFFGDKNCAGGDCVDVVNYIKYPENIISGLLLHAQEDGIVITMDSNQTSLENLANIPLEQSLARIVPEKVDGRWTDIFLEYGNPHELYYNFKKNNLTDDGLKAWNKATSEIKSVVGIDPEANFIDLIKGSGAGAIFTAKGDSPEGAMMLEITDAGKMDDTMHKLVSAIKQYQIEKYSTMINSSSSANIPPELLRNTVYAKLLKQSQDMKKEYQQLLERVKNSAIQETDLPEGKIYSYAIESPQSSGLVPSFSVTLNYSLEDGRFIFSTDQSAVRSLLSNLKNPAQTGSLANNAFYKTASKYYAPNYVNSYLNTQGIADAARYYYGRFMDAMGSIQTGLCANDATGQCQQNLAQVEAQKAKASEQFEAYLAVLRTVKFVGAYSSAADQSVKKSWFIDIEELPKAEKDQADRILSGM